MLRYVDLWTYIIWLSQVLLPVSKLTILGEWAPASVQKMFAQLSFVLLLQCVELALISVEVVVV